MPRIAEAAPATKSMRDLSRPRDRGINNQRSRQTKCGGRRTRRIRRQGHRALSLRRLLRRQSRRRIRSMRHRCHPHSSNPPASTTAEQRPVPLVASEVPAVSKSDEPAPPAEGPMKLATATETPPAPESADKTSTTSVPEPLPNPPASIQKAEGLGDVAAANSTPSSSRNAATARRPRQVTASDSSQARAQTHDLTRLRRGGRGRLRFVLDEPGFRGAVPRGVARARFVGTTPDGMWMLALPSHEIVVVPPPPGY